MNLRRGIEFLLREVIEKLERSWNEIESDMSLSEVMEKYDSISVFEGKDGVVLRGIKYGKGIRTGDETRYEYTTGVIGFVREERKAENFVQLFRIYKKLLKIYEEVKQ